MTREYLDSFNFPLLLIPEFQGNPGIYLLDNVYFNDSLFKTKQNNLLHIRDFLDYSCTSGSDSALPFYHKILVSMGLI